jgi:prepilin-type N-terminal cleavage/methylation domain-containing protein
MLIIRNSNHGYSLIEMMVVVTVFVVVLLITGSVLKTILGNTRVTFSSEQSSIEGVVGLEMLRHDLQQAGFALFSDEHSVPTFAEAGAAPFSTYNDANAVPRAIVTGDNVNLGNNEIVMTGTDYLAIKATTVGIADTVQRWTYITDTGVPKKWGTNDFINSSDKLIALQQYFDRSANKVYRGLVRVSDANYAFSYFDSGLFRDQSNNVVTNYSPAASKQFYLYGLTRSASTTFTVRAPFNRVDYYIKRLNAGMPGSCSDDSGILYKSLMNHDNVGSFTDIPILNCVADLQIVLGWNTQSDPESRSNVDAFSNGDGSSTAGNLNGINIQTVMLNAEEVRRRLKLIKVYILAQDGGRDLNFNNTINSMLVGDVGEAALTNTVNLTTVNKRNYRWKLYRIIVSPKNL